MLKLLRIPLVLLLTATSPGALSRAQAQSPRVIEITAERFEFWPSEIRLDQGEEVEELRIVAVRFEQTGRRPSSDSRPDPNRRPSDPPTDPNDQTNQSNATEPAPVSTNDSHDQDSDLS